MVTSDNHNDAYEKMLVQNLQRVLDFLRYAEAKNAALLTVSSALTIAIANLLLNISLPPGLQKGLWIALSLMLIAGLIAISTFMPRLSLPRFLGGKASGPHDKNLIYFGDIASLTVKEYRESLDRRYGSPNEARLKDDYYHDLLVQIVVNSKITNRKMREFRVGSSVLAAAGIIVVITTAVYGYQFLVAK